MQAGEVLLQRNKSSFLSYFEEAILLDDKNPDLFLKQAQSLIFSGKKHQSKKLLVLASKRCKQANFLQPSLEGYLLWAESLFEIGNIEDQSCYFTQSKEKIMQAFILVDERSNIEKFEIHWLLGRIYLALSHYSEEAIDIKNALDQFRCALLYHKSSDPYFWHDFGKAYLEMGLLTNDNELYLRGIHHFSKALSFRENHVFSLASTAYAYSQLYINTLDQNYLSQADLYYSKIKNPTSEHLLEWSSLLCEAGKNENSLKKLQKALQICQKAKKADPVNPSILALWVEIQSYIGLFLEDFSLLEQAELEIIDWTEEISNNTDLWYAYGTCLLCFAQYFDDLHFHDLAMEKVQNGLDIDSSNAELWHLAGKIQQQIGLFTEDVRTLALSSQFLAKAMTLKPKYPVLYYDCSITLAKLAELTSDDALYEKSIFYFEQIFHAQKNILLSNPEWVFSYATILDAYGNQKEEEKYIIRAVEIFWQLLLLDTSFPRIYFQLGIAFSHLAEMTSEQAYFEKAFSYYLLASQKDPENDAIWLEWGLALTSYANQISDFLEEEKLQYYREAERKLLHAGSLGSSHSYYHLSCLYSLKGELENSFIFLRKAQKMDVLPPVQELMEDEWLEALRDTDTFSSFVQSLTSQDSTKS